MTGFLMPNLTSDFIQKVGKFSIIQQLFISMDFDVFFPSSATKGQYCIIRYQEGEMVALTASNQVTDISDVVTGKYLLTDDPLALLFACKDTLIKSSLDKRLQDFPAVKKFYKQWLKTVA